MHRAVPLFFAVSRLTFCGLVALAASGCGDEEAAGTSSTGGGPTAATPRTSAKVSPSGENPSAPDRYAAAPPVLQPVVRITTSLGPIDVRLDAEAAYVTVQNFLNYAKSGYYDQTVFHYVEKGQLILGGGFLEDGTARPVRPPILNEAHNGRKNTQGTIAMARDAAAIDSATSQFFINLVDAPHLDHAGEAPAEYGYCVFGEVIDGLDVAREIASAPTETRVIDGEEMVVPAKTVRIESVSILR
jgi:cyclophilin family peptidyl-prolyl cis-trans isomerase